METWEDIVEFIAYLRDDVSTFITIRTNRLYLDKHPEVDGCICCPFMQSNGIPIIYVVEDNKTRLDESKRREL